ncbi:MAG: DNA polymerase IV [Gammaproteobacteria bacterium]
MLIKTRAIVQTRKIIHIDMDAFYAAVEQRDQPTLRGKPVIVGGAPERRGVVAACSYEAREYGIHSAMPSAQALKLCPQAVFIKPRFDTYRGISAQIMQILANFTPLVEPLSLDEAYLDVTDCRRHDGSATLIARALKGQIREATGLIASAGVSYNKFLAKMASDRDKPDGLYVITPEQGPEFVRQLPIGDFYGVGRATEAKMKALHIETGADLLLLSRDQLRFHLGKAGDYYYDIARGTDNRPVKPQRERKSISNETTFLHDLQDKAMMLEQLHSLAAATLTTLRDKQLQACTVTIKVKYADFQQVTRSKTLTTAFTDHAAIADVLAELLDKTEAGNRKVRLLGVGVSNLQPLAARQQQEQITLLP